MNATELRAKLLAAMEEFVRRLPPAGVPNALLSAADLPSMAEALIPVIQQPELFPETDEVTLLKGDNAHLAELLRAAYPHVHNRAEQLADAGNTVFSRECRDLCTQIREALGDGEAEAIARAVADERLLFWLCVCSHTAKAIADGETTGSEAAALAPALAALLAAYGYDAARIVRAIDMGEPGQSPKPAVAAEHPDRIDMRVSLRVGHAEIDMPRCGSTDAAGGQGQCVLGAGHPGAHLGSGEETWAEAPPYSPVLVLEGQGYALTDRDGKPVGVGGRSRGEVIETRAQPILQRLMGRERYAESLPDSGTLTLDDYVDGVKWSDIRDALLEMGDECL